MGALSIPEAIVENGKVTWEGKGAYAGFFSMLKKGDRPSLVLDDWMPTIGVHSREDMLAALASLVENEYARVDEAVCPLADMVPDQRVRITAHIHVEVLPLLPMDEESVNERRYPGDDVLARDVTQFGKTVYLASVSRLVGRYLLTVRAQRNDLETTLIGEQDFDSQRKAWDYYDEWVAPIREAYGNGEAVPGPTDKDADLVESLKGLGWREDDAKKIALMTTEEMEPSERMRRALEWLDSNGRRR